MKSSQLILIAVGAFSLVILAYSIVMSGSHPGVASNFSEEALLNKRLVTDEDLTTLSFDPRQHVRMSDLPEPCRVFTPHRRIRTMDFRPNRLNIDVDDNNVIVKVYHG
jgi:hypothetical protein